MLLPYNMGGKKLQFFFFILCFLQEVGLQMTLGNVMKHRDISSLSPILTSSPSPKY